MPSACVSVQQTAIVDWRSTVVVDLPRPHFTPLERERLRLLLELESEPEEEEELPESESESESGPDDLRQTRAYQNLAQIGIGHDTDWTHLDHSLPLSLFATANLFFLLGIGIFGHPVFVLYVRPTGLCPITVSDCWR